MNVPHPAPLARHLGPLALAGLLAGCGGGSSGPADAALDLSPFVTMLGLVGGELPVVKSSHFGPDTTCGSRGVVLHLAETTDGGCGPDATAKRNVRIYFSDFLPSTFTRTLSTQCPTKAGAKEYFATFRSDMSGDYDSFKGGVTINYYDGATLGGVYDITFASRATPGFDNGHFSGSFLSQHCP